MENLGLPGYVQELSSAGEGFVPAFDLTGVGSESGEGRVESGEGRVECGEGRVESGE